MTDKNQTDPADEPPLTISRRNLFGGLALGLLMPRALSAQQVAEAILRMDRVDIHNMLRGLVFLDQFDDPVMTEDAQALLEQITTVAPEAPIVMDIYRFHNEISYHPYRRDQDDGDLLILHNAVARAQRVSFEYCDLQGDTTQRRVLPLALVHPPHGIQLLAYCELRRDYRKFFVHAMSDLIEGDAQAEAGFAEERLALLQGLWASEYADQAEIDSTASLPLV